MRKVYLCIVLLIVSNVLFLSGCQTGQTKAPEVLAEFEIEDYTNGILLPVRIQGKEYRFILDTGGSSTVFDDSLKGMLGKQISSNSKGAFPYNDTNVSIERFDAPDVYLGSLNLKVFSFVKVVDLDRVIPGLSNIYQGIIGMDFLKSYIVQIDFDTEKVRILNKRKDFNIFSFLDANKRTYKDWGEPIEIKTNKFDHQYVRGKVLDNIYTDFLIDTGCNFPGLLKKDIFEEMSSHLDTAENDRKLEIESEGKNYLGNIIKTDRFSVGKFNYKEMIFKEFSESILGLPFLSHHVVTFDFPNNTMYLKKGERFGKQFGFSTSTANAGFVLSLYDGNLIVSYVDPNGPAQRKGIKKNDVVQKMQINEQVLTSFNTFDFLEFLSKLSGSGDRSSIFTFRRGDDIFTVEFTKQDLSK